MENGWHFIDDKGSFQLPNPQYTSHLYFPLINEAGMVSSITPMLNGDAKKNQNSFLLLPTTVEDLHNTRSARNFWLRINNTLIWSVTGNSAAETANKHTPEEDIVSLSAGFLWHKITRQHKSTGLEAEITNFVPANDDTVELMRVQIKNNGGKPVQLTPTAAVPIFGRSADNLRDHRHVTSLLHRIKCVDAGVIVRPTLSFDERGHTINQTTYGVLGVEGDGSHPVGFFPTLEDFIGEGGTLDWPDSVIDQNPKLVLAGRDIHGYEALGSIRFDDFKLQPDEEITYILILFIQEDEPKLKNLIERYGSSDNFQQELEKTENYWQNKLSTLGFETGDKRFDNWLKWVTIQPILRRRVGNSFLPYHDYGRGGRGWRDLWQDILALLLMDNQDVSELLLGYFAGVRMDGSNATIIGINSGEFKADRNDIPRVWMDHGLWPLLTTDLFINLSGNLDFLLKDQIYFKDQISHRAKQHDPKWQPEDGTIVQTESGETYQGTILEHILVQHLTAFFNVGEHNNILLEDADWNDALDMANERGESVAFSAFYAGNLRIIAELCQGLLNEGVEQVNLVQELGILMDTITSEVDYDSHHEKKERLLNYFNQIRSNVSGKKVAISLQNLIDDLLAKADWLTNHIRSQEWIEIDKDKGWFNSYYNNQGDRVEGIIENDIRMMLTGQVFTLMFNIASDEQVQQIVNAADAYLFDETVGGYRLNTDFLAKVESLGRVYGFAYGHKENGAMFSHMSMMFANALYKRNMVEEGWKTLKTVYNFSQDFSKSHMYPGIPEYFSQRGRGMYPYLTGSASWLLLTLLTESYGVKGRLGNLVLEPKLMQDQFDPDGNSWVHTLFAGRRCRICFSNPDSLPYGSYVIRQIELNGTLIMSNGSEPSFVIPADQISAWPENVEIRVQLSEK